jgi:hypothetical protein
MLPIWEAQVHLLRIDPNLDRADRYLQFGDFFNGAQVRHNIVQNEPPSYL